MKKTLEIRREKNIRLLRSELERIVTELRELGVKKIIHFGSSVRGEAGLNSDLDLIVVMESEEDFPARVAGIYKKIKPRVAVDFLVYTPGEFENMKDNSIFLKNALREGETLYET